MTRPIQTLASPRAGQPRSGIPVRRFGALFTAALAGLYAGHLLAALPGMIAEAGACAAECVVASATRALP